jgi:hypothetical protein
MPVTVRISFFLLAAIALGWLIFGLMAVFNVLTFIPVAQIRLAIGGIAIACSIITVGGIYFLYHRNKFSYYSTVTILAMFLSVSFMDELGLTDAILIGTTVLTLILLIKDRNWLLGKKIIR